MKFRDIVEWGTATGAPVTAHGSTVRPVSWSLVVRLPFAGFTWSRPVAVLIDEQERLPIIDVTRAAQLSLLAVVALFTLIGWRLSQNE